jgi:AraC-like DNA-binding protein
MPWSRVLNFTDPLACQAAIQTSDVELFPTAKGNFNIEITQLGLNTLWMQRFRVSLPLVNTVVTKPGRRSIGFLTESISSTLQHCGIEVSPGDIVLNPSGVAHQRTMANLHYAVMSLPIEILNEAIEAIVGCQLPETKREHVVRLAPPLMARLLRLHKTIGQLAHDTPDVLGLPEVRQAMEEQLIHVMVRCLAEGTAVETTTRRRHDAIIARLEDFLEANPDRPIYLTEICSVIGVAERTLRAVCEEHLGMGPIRYLALRRMHLVRRALLRADPSKSTVTRVVTDHGFWELGRFSVAYRALFGESPSETLRHYSR